MHLSSDTLVESVHSVLNVFIRREELSNLSVTKQSIKEELEEVKDSFVLSVSHM